MTTIAFDGDGMTEALGEDATNVATRQVVIATLAFLGAEIKANLQESDPGVSAVLHLIESLAQETSKSLTSVQAAKAELPAELAAGRVRPYGRQQFVH